MSEETEFFSNTVRLRPQNLESLRSRIDAFVQSMRTAGRPIVLITSGGTTVPLEINTVRFIDNFSTGTRGAQCTEEFLKAGYAVLLLYRKGSGFPFLASTVRRLKEDPLGLLAAPKLETSGSEGLREFLLPIGFTTIFDYLFMLRDACWGLQSAGADAIVLLAAAVSDFYVPEREMSTGKIQSRSCDGLNIQLRNVPKMLGSIKRWSPEALVMSFKLETNANILLAKAAGSIKKYDIDAVCANLLHNYRDFVTVIRRDPQAPAIKLGSDEIHGEETEPISVQGVTSQGIERGSSAHIDGLLVQAIVAMHEPRRSPGQEGRAPEPAAKRCRVEGGGSAE